MLHLPVQVLEHVLVAFPCVHDLLRARNTQEHRQGHLQSQCKQQDNPNVLSKALLNMQLNIR